MPTRSTFNWLVGLLLTSYIYRNDGPGLLNGIIPLPHGTTNSVPPSANATLVCTSTSTRSDVGYLTAHADAVTSSNPTTASGKSLPDVVIHFDLPRRRFNPAKPSLPLR